MAEQKNIADYYLDRYRKHIRFSNIALSVALLVLIVNWLFSIEPQYASVQQTLKKYKSQLKVAQKKLDRYSDLYSTSYNYAHNPPRGFRKIETINKPDSVLLIQYKQVGDTLKRKIDSLNNKIDILENYGNDLVLIETEKFRDSLLKFERSIEAAKHTILFKDSVGHVKTQITELKNQKTKSINDTLQDYDWKSLIRFIFLVAADPKEGTIYLMGLITLMIVFAFVSRWFCLRYLAKGIRIYKSETPVINVFNDLNISAPFWLTPLPLDIRSVNKQRLQNKVLKTNVVKQNEMATFIGVLHVKNQYSVIIILSLLILFVLQLRLFYISFQSSLSIRFDFIFTIGVILSLISLVQIFIWFIPLKIDDHLNYEPPVNNVTRRTFIALSISSCAAFLLFWKKDKISAFYKLNSKRFVRLSKNKHLRKVNTHSTGLYLHESFQRKTLKRVKGQGKQLLYFIDKKSHSPVLKDIQNNEHLKRFENSLQAMKVEQLRLNVAYNIAPQSFSWTLEHITLYLIQTRTANDGKEFIYHHIDRYASYYSSDYRLTDLAAKLFIRHNKGENYLEQLILKCTPARDENESDDEDGMRPIVTRNRALYQRLENWQNKRWVEKIKKKKYLVWDSTNI